MGFFLASQANLPDAKPSGFESTTRLNIRHRIYEQEYLAKVFEAALIPVWPQCTPQLTHRPQLLQRR